TTLKLPEETFGLVVLESAFFRPLPKKAVFGTELAGLEPFKFNRALLTAPTVETAVAIDGWFVILYLKKMKK
ncbi:hypothetical protein L2E31_25125, partial [Salmonella enterica subsp. enterica serovar Weltevreden]|nr:hypothetical protein [Salmonella enterica subsp. enterica serovar Weltevreden]